MSSYISWFGSTMNLRRAVLALVSLSATQARVGDQDRRKIGSDNYSATKYDLDYYYAASSDEENMVEVVVTFKNDDVDVFDDMSEVFSGLSEEIEVHSMLKNMRMATLRAPPMVRILNTTFVDHVHIDLIILYHMHRLLQS